jgi:hypothetical protein
MYSESVKVGTEYIDLGITGVSCYKSGNVVQLNISIPISESTGNKWLTLGILPQELRPKTQINGCGYDNSGSTYDGAKIIANRLLASDGSLSVYVFNDHKSFDYRAILTYLI